jgi:hypothetical protein
MWLTRPISHNSNGLILLFAWFTHLIDYGLNLFGMFEM